MCYVPKGLRLVHGGDQSQQEGDVLPRVLCIYDENDENALLAVFAANVVVVYFGCHARSHSAGGAVKVLGGGGMRSRRPP